MNPLLITPALTGTVFIIAGFIMLKFPPKEINDIYGYRTSRSKKNKANWDFAQTYSAKEMIKIGIVLLLFSIVGFFTRPNNVLATIIAITVLVALTAFLLIRVERAIKRNEQRVSNTDS